MSGPPPTLEKKPLRPSTKGIGVTMSDSGGVQYLTLRQTMTWEEVVDILGVNDQELYLKWIRIYFRMGNDNSFKKHGLWFPNPLRRSAKKSSHALDIVFKVGDKFPRPHGKEWENFVEATQPVQFDPAESEMFAEFEHNGVEMMVL